MYRGLGDPQIGPVVPIAPPATEAQRAADLAQAQQNYVDRAARCKVYQQKDWAMTIASGVGAALILPGWWKVLALPFMVVIDSQVIPRSPDCDYGM